MCSDIYYVLTFGTDRLCDRMVRKASPEGAIVTVDASAPVAAQIAPDVLTEASRKPCGWVSIWLLPALYLKNALTL